MSNPINHGSNNDRNIIAQVVYDKGGRITSIRDPKGNLTQYQYDLLGRPKQTTNPLSKVWTTTYTDVMNMGSPTGERQTSITDPNGVSTQQDFDRLGRVASISYGTPANTPDVGFSYNELGHLTTMTETGASSAVVRETDYNYDALGRVTAVDFDTDGNGTTDETISYEYNAGGLRTKMTLPGSLDINYEYDENGQLIRLTDWDSQATQFAYDRLGRHIATKRDNGLRTRYGYDAGGRLRLLRHTSGKETLGHFAYETDAVGNRTQALEVVPHTGAGTTTISHDDDEVTYRGTWSTVGGYLETSVFSASLELMFFGDETVSLKMGEGPNHSLYDIYLNGALWKTIDGYATSNAERTISIDIQGDGPHKLEVRNRPQHSKSARDAGGFDPSDYTLRFKSLSVAGSYDLHTILYSYDTVYRLLDAAYYAGHNTGATAFRQYEYDFDVAGNRTQQVQTIAGTPTTTNYTYNAGNQLTGDGTKTYTYDNNGNLTNDGTNTYTWDLANRLLSVGSTSYLYDGYGNRIQKTVSSIVTDYLLDLQAGLTTVVAANTGANTTRYLHSISGLHAQEDNSGNWVHPIHDGVGSTRGVVSDTLAQQESRLYDPFGVPFGNTGTSQTDFGFTGEQTDDNDLLYLRARYYNPETGVFLRRDPDPGRSDEPLTLNGYGYVAGNPINFVDPTGLNFAAAHQAGEGRSGGRGRGGTPRRNPVKPPVKHIPPPAPPPVGNPYNGPRPARGGSSAPLPPKVVAALGGFTPRPKNPQPPVKQTPKNPDTPRVPVPVPDNDDSSCGPESIDECYARCRSENSDFLAYFTCVNECNGAPFINTYNAIRDSTVAITVGAYSVTTCPRSGLDTDGLSNTKTCPGVHIGLGTITDNGVISHNHLYQDGATYNNILQSLLSDGMEWIELRGAYGTIHGTIDGNWGSSIGSSTTSPIFTTSQDTINLNIPFTIGRVASRTSRQDIVNTYSSLYFVYDSQLRGEPASISPNFQNDKQHSDFAVGIGYIDPLNPIPYVDGSRIRALKSPVVPISAPVSGDSGGGVFGVVNGNLDLLGVMQSGVGTDRSNLTGFEFSPLR